MLLATSISLDSERLPIKVYTTADGLAHNTVNRIVKDSRGFLWFCTADGLSRFDGYSFRTFAAEHGLPHSSVTDLLETRTGEFWVGTKGGLARFEPKRSSPSAMFTVVVNADSAAGASEVTALSEARDGTIWVGTNGGLYRLEQSAERWSLRPVDVRIPDEYPEQREVTDVIEDARGSLWIAALSGLYRRWPDGRTARYTKRDGLPSEMLSDLFEDRRGRLWAGTADAGFFRFTADAGPSPLVVDSTFDVAHGLPSHWVFRLFETSDGQFWIATANGLVRFFQTADQGGRRFRSYGERSGVTDFQILSVTDDLGGNLWLGSGNAGAMKLTHGGFSTYGAPDGIRAVNDIFEDAAGQICFRGIVLGDHQRTVFEGAVLDVLSAEEPGLHGRLGCYDGQRIDWFHPAALTNVGWVQSGITLRARNGEWWVGSGDGVHRYAPVAALTALKVARPIDVYTVKDGLAGSQAFALFEDSRGDMWISTTSATTHGLARWERATERLRDLTLTPGMPSLKDNVARGFAEDRAGAVWIGFNRGLGRYHLGRVRFFTEKDGLPPGHIRDIHVDRAGRLWLASAQSGLVRVEDGATETPRFVAYTTAKGLSSNSTDVIVEDGDGHILVGGGRGLDRLDPASGRVRRYTTADGLPGGLFRAALRDRRGVIWLGTTLGLARLTPVAMKSAGPPPIVIDGLRVRGVARALSVLGERELSLSPLSAGDNQLQIDFAGLSFVPGEALRYQYRLDRGASDWSPATAARTVTYASLSPGRYRFDVRAVNSEGLASAVPASVSFTISPPLWLRWWFVTLAGLGAVLTVHAAYRYRLSRLLEMADLRTRIATDLHDDIGANLTRIALLSEVAMHAPAGATGAVARASTAAAGTIDRVVDAKLSSIAQIARESVSTMSDIVWAINPRSESLLDLTRRMRQHAEELFTARGIDLQFNAPDGRHSPRIGVDVRRGLLLIFKEAVSNVAKHSGCSAVRVDLQQAGSQLVLTVSDNGRGFDPEIEADGQGCPSMRRRARKLGGELRIVSGKQPGTAVTLVTPL